MKIPSYLILLRNLYTQNLGINQQHNRQHVAHFALMSNVLLSNSKVAFQTMFGV